MVQGCGAIVIPNFVWMWYDKKVTICRHRQSDAVQEGTVHDELQGHG